MTRAELAARSPYVASLVRCIEEGEDKPARERHRHRIARLIGKRRGIEARRKHKRRERAKERA